MEYSLPTQNINDKKVLNQRSFQSTFVEGKNNHIKSLPSHPLIKLLDRDLEKRECKKLQEISMLFGSSLAMEKQIQRSIAGSNSRGSTFKTSNHGLKQSMGLYDKIEIYDFIGTQKPFDVDQSLFYKAYN